MLSIPLITYFLFRYRLLQDKYKSYDLEDVI